jgi:hypothetical protein
MQLKRSSYLNTGGWSQGTWSSGSVGGSGPIGLRGGCLGAHPKTRGVAPGQGGPPTRGRAAQGGGPRGTGREVRDPSTSQVRFGAARPQVLRGARSRCKMVPPPKRRPSPSPSPTPGRGHWGQLGSNRGGRGRRGVTRRQPPRRPPSPDPGRAPGPLQLMGPGDHPMQKLALMMAVMMLGMSPVNGCSASVDSRSQGVGDRAEMVPSPSTWFSSSREALITGRRVSPAASIGDQPVEPGGFPVKRILQQIQQGMEGLVKMKNEVLRVGQDSRPKTEATQKAMDALKKGADATRGRGQRKGRLYQRAGIRN